MHVYVSDLSTMLFLFPGENLALPIIAISHLRVFLMFLWSGVECKVGTAFRC